MKCFLNLFDRGNFTEKETQWDHPRTQLRKRQYKEYGPTLTIRTYQWVLNLSWKLSKFRSCHPSLRPID